jgi:hypothetical protein
VSVSAPVYVTAIGLAGPGLASWDAARAVLAGAEDYVAAELPPYQPQLLPPNERRRATPAVRQAFRAAEDAVARAPRPAAELATVFASSDADMSIIHRICGALSEDSRIISPTDFHNSVHNAAAGYWSIAVGARGPSNTLCAYDASFASGLLEAAAQTSAERCDTLLVAYDVPPPEPLNAKRPIGSAFSVALVLSPAATAAPALRLEVSPEGEETAMEHAALEALRLSNPAARALPLLRLLAAGRSGTVLLDNNGSGLLHITVTA